MRPSSLVSLAVSLLATARSAAATRTFRVKNNCRYQIWPAIFTSAGTAPEHATGWRAKPGSSVSFKVAEDWNGRIWGRTGCDFSTGSKLPSTCLTGGCNGGLECARSGGTGVSPASLAEFNLNDANDWYDVSLVDGFNLQMSITNNKGCKSPTCGVDLNPKCPAELSVHNPKGKTVGCLTACGANLDGNPANSQNCCSGDYSTPDKCPASGVQYNSFFKKYCKDAYSFAYDESSGSALWTCKHSLKADYTVTFCVCHSLASR
ncbi:hypothetical protein JCM6882_001653 [Rhodosporidiobolus microsporus]